MKDILLVDDDLYVTDTGDIRLTDRVSQAAKIRLRWFKMNGALGLGSECHTMTNF